MTNADRILATVAIISLIVFLAVLMLYVPQPALIVVCVLTILMAAFDFIREFRIAHRDSLDKR